MTARRIALLPALFVLSAAAAAASGVLDLQGEPPAAPAGIAELPTTPRPTRTPAPTPAITASPVPTPAPTEIPPPPPPPTPFPTPEPTPEPPPPQPLVIAPPSGPPCGGPPFLTWVWRFSTDGPAAEIAARLADQRAGVLLKTHDGVDWMSRWDPSPDAVRGPQRVAEVAQFFEAAGIPFHAWAVVEGRDPLREAQMASEVLAAGARSLTLDLEPWAAFWEGTPETARAFGEELRRLQPSATIITSIDPRPWTLNDIPLAEFAAFSNALAPTIYWETFDSGPNRAGYAESGYIPPEEKAAPEFFLDASADALLPLGLPIRPVGQGDSDAGRWARFVDHSTASGMPAVSVWRYGVVGEEVRSVLSERTPSGQLYAVQPGDTLFGIGQLWGVDGMRIASANRLADPNVLFVGQELCIPLG